MSFIKKEAIEWAIVIAGAGLFLSIEPIINVMTGAQM